MLETQSPTTEGKQTHLILPLALNNHYKVTNPEKKTLRTKSVGAFQSCILERKLGVWISEPKESRGMKGGTATNNWVMCDKVNSWVQHRLETHTRWALVQDTVKQWCEDIKRWGTWMLVQDTPMMQSAHHNITGVMQWCEDMHHTHIAHTRARGLLGLGNLSILSILLSETTVRL